MPTSSPRLLSSWRAWMFPLALTVALAAIIYSDHHLLFHTLAELFAISVAVITFVVVWYTHGFTRNYYLLYVGIGYFWIAILDTLHTFSYAGMPLLPGAGGNLSAQFWIITRYLESLLILTAPFFLNRRFNSIFLFAVFGAIATIAATAVLMGVYPATYIPGQGLTVFKIVSEYTIVAILIAALGLIYTRRALIGHRVFPLMAASIVATVAAELSFTFYVGVFDLSNLMGHAFKLASYWLIFLAIIRTSLTDPFSVMARSAGSFDAVPDPVVVVEADGTIEQANAAACKSAGVAVENIVGASVHDLFHPAEFDRADCPLCDAIRTGTGVPEMRHHSPAADRWWSYTLTPMIAKGHPGLMVHMRRDTTRGARARENARLLNTAISQIQASVIITDENGIIEYVNPAFEAVTGYSRSEVIGETPGILKSGQTPATVYARMWERIQSDRPWRGELLNRRKNGELYWDEVSISPVTDAAGETTHFISVQEDITKRRRTEDMILRLGRMVDDSGSEIFVFDVETLRIVQANRGVSDNLGFAREELTQMTPCDFIEDMDEQTLRWHLAPLSTPGAKPVQIETRQRRKDASVRAVTLRIRLVPTETPPVYMAVGEDVTEKRQLEEVLRQTTKMEGIGRLTGGIAHDFNNLLGIIIGNLDMLEDDLADTTEEKVPELAAAQRAAQRGADLTRRLLAFSRHSPRAESSVSPSDIVRDMAPMLERLASDQIKLSLRVGDGSGHVLLDPGDFEDALLNLCVNAIDAMPDGGVLGISVEETTVHVGDDAYASGARAGDYVVTTVSDTGIGIPVHIRDRIFEPFFSTKPRDRGTGLGLSMVYGFTSRTGGHVTIDDNPEGGSRFHLYLPRHAEGRATSPSPSGHSSNDAAVPHGHGETILVVDDEPDLVRIAENALSGLGYRVLAADGPVEALAILDHPDAGVDLLFTDIVMPGNMSGLELANTACENHPDLRCLITTGHAGDQDKTRGWETAWPILMKPYTRGDLAKAVRDALGG